MSPNLESVIFLWLSFSIVFVHCQNNSTENAGGISNIRDTSNKVVKVILSYMPEFYSPKRCSKPSKSTEKISDLIMLDVAKMPFNLEQWIHVDVLPTKTAISSNKVLKIRYAMIQITDSINQVIGRMGEQIPCEDMNHPHYLDGKGKISQLYRNPGVTNVWAYECPMIDYLSYNMPPSVTILSFPVAPVEAFYVNIGLTKEEGDYIKNQTKIYITTMLVDDEGDCHLHRVGPLVGVPTAAEFKTPKVEVPIKCHLAGPAFQTTDQQQSPLIMKSPISWKDVEFTNATVRRRPRKDIAHVGKPDWRAEIEEYNLKVNGLNADGYTAAELREEEEALNVNAAQVYGEQIVNRRPHVPLVDDDDTVDFELERAFTKIFDEDDEECDDDLRIKKPENVENEVSKIYLECKYSRQCVGEPDGCLEDKNCDFVVSWGREDDYLNFGVAATKVTFVAVAVSLDDKMGNDSVTECNREDNNVVAGYTSWNFVNEEQRGNTRLRSCESMKDFTAVLFDEDKIFCSWKRPVVTKVKGQTFDLNRPYYILMSRGQTSSHGVLGNLMKHDYQRVAATTDEVFNKYMGKSPFQYILARIHGIVLIVTWMFLVPIATFVSRYLKGTFVSRRIRVYSVWYGLHIILVTFVIVTSFGATLILYIFNNYERAKEESRFSTHSTVGILILIMILLQMLMAYLMAEHNEKWMKLSQVKFLHGMNGHLMTICGFVCLFTSRYIKDGLPCNIIVSSSMYFACYIILHLLMSYQICYSDFVRGYETSRVYKVFIVDHDKEHDQPRRPPPRKLESMKAEALRKRRITLDDIDIENMEEGSVINPTIMRASSTSFRSDSFHDIADEEEPGAPMRRVIFVLFIFILASFTIYYIFLMLFPQYYLDCPSQQLLQPGVMYSAGYLYF